VLKAASNYLGKGEEYKKLKENFKSENPYTFRNFINDAKSFFMLPRINYDKLAEVKFKGSS